MKITRLRIKSYRGIEELDTPIGDAGAIVSGRNKRGKTTVLNALKAALLGEGCDKSDVRLTKDRAEILIDLDALRVKRTITESGSKLEVTNLDGDVKKQPQTFLRGMFGTMLDPLALYTAKGGDRRAMILSAMPIKVTTDQLVEWVPGLKDSTLGDVSDHGLAVVARLRARHYEARTIANREADAARAAADHAKTDAAARALTVPKDALELRAAVKACGEAEVALRRLEERARTAAEQAERTKGTRERIARLREKAVAARSDAAARLPGDETMEQAFNEFEDADGCLTAATLALRAAEEIHSRAAARAAAARERVDDLKEKKRASGEYVKIAESLDAQATAQETALAESAAAPVEPAAIEAARAALGAAQDARRGADAAGDLRKVREQAAKVDAHAAALEKDAARLDVIVKALTNDVPAKLLTDAKGFPGLGLDGDDITLDGKPLPALSGAEQLAFAVNVAKRLSRTKVLVCDGLEKLDPVEMGTFVTVATEDGWQLLGTRVDSGDLIVEALSADAVVADAPAR